MCQGDEYILHIWLDCFLIPNGVSVDGKLPQFLFLVDSLSKDFLPVISGSLLMELLWLDLPCLIMSCGYWVRNGQVEWWYCWMKF
jgi:hypothetical protein